MAAIVADDFKERVRTGTDIVGLISESVTLQSQRGGREFVGLCPFHDDHNPSMRVYADRQSWRCWVCDEGGDCFSFVMKRERIGFREALEMLANRAHIELPKTYRRAEGDSAENKNLHYEIVSWADREFHECLLNAPQAEPARQYLSDRGISDESVSKFGLGYHPENWEWLIGKARQKKYTPEQLLAVGLVGARSNGSGLRDNFVNRVMFPIRDAQGRPVAFGGRVLPGSSDSDGPKYWNSPDHVLFHKSRFLYGLDQARDTIAKSGTAVVVEGYTDCIMPHQFGLTNFVATLGTALNETHVANLKRFARKVILVYDGDEAGQLATERALPRLLAQAVDLRIATLPGGLDPADFLEKHGGPALHEILEKSVEAWDQKYRTCVGRYGLDSIDSRHRVLADMLEVLSQVPVSTGNLAAQWQERENVILGRLAQQLRVSETFVRQRLDDLRTAQQQRGERPAQSAGVAETQRPATCTFPKNPTRDEHAEREVLEIIFTLPEKTEKIRAEIRPAEFTHDHLRELLGVCFAMLDEGIPPSYDRVTARLEDAGLKRLAAEIDEHARQLKISSDHISPLMEFFRRRREIHAPAAAISGEQHLEQASESAQLDAKARLRQATELHRKRVSKSTLT